MSRPIWLLMAGIAFGPLVGCSDGTRVGFTANADAGSGPSLTPVAPEGAGCRANGDCAAGQVCLGGACAADPCAGAAACPAGTTCQAECVPTADLCASVQCG